MAQAASGDPLRLLTLTVNPAYYANPEERLTKLAWAWRTCVKRLRRDLGADSIEYFAVVEETKAGEPHLHILLRSPFIPQRYISAVLGELINAPIVDIRRVRSASDVVRYVAKYITKKPAQFGTSKRYWQSRHYSLDSRPSEEPKPTDSLKWEIWREGLHSLLRAWIEGGLAARSDGKDAWVAYPTEYEFRSDTS